MASVHNPLAIAVKICSYNMHGFKNGLPMARELCKTHDLILLQEHWLLKNNLDKLDSIDRDFMSFNLSSMNAKSASGIMIGRPFGGVGILWRKNLANCIEILEGDENDGKFLSIMLHSGTYDIVITCVYFPCLSALNEYTISSSAIISHIDSMLTNYPTAKHIIAGDFNFECTNNIGFNLFSEVVKDYGLYACDELHVNKVLGHTYRHETLNHFSWIDHFFISNDLRKSVRGCEIIDSGANLSDHHPISLVLEILPLAGKPRGCDPPKRQYKERWDKADLSAYYSKGGILLQSIATPTSLLHCKAGCRCTDSRTCINNYYNSIVKALKTAAVGCVPKIPINSLKPFWNADLDKLKETSIDMHKLWRQVGSPKHGIINSARITAKLDYKSAIKKAAQDFEQNNASELNKHLIDKDSKSFWKCWNANYRKSLVNTNIIDGEMDPGTIANKFRDYYAKIYVDSGANFAAVSEFEQLYNKMSSNKSLVNENCLPNVDVESIEKCISELKANKAAGHDGIVAEHIINSHPAIVVHLKLLFSMMLSHDYVPDAFGLGVVVPIVKDKCGNLSNIDNYRPITLSPVISKVFEAFLLHKYGHYIHTDDLQFGFKQGLGCSNAIFALRQAVEYFNNRSSNVYVASLDASKAFDRVNHFKLFSVLIRSGLPQCFINVIVNWYAKLSVVVKWNNCNSSTLSVLSGVRQGGLLSPILFNLYVNNMISSLRNKKYGCHLGNVYLGCIMYADDLLLLSGSVMELQRMLDCCGKVGEDIGLSFNSKKSHCMVIGSFKVPTPLPMSINGAAIMWTDTIKYLGINIVSDVKFTIDLAETRRKFFVAVNTILSKCKYSTDVVKLELMESHCLPILLYGLEGLNLNAAQMKDINSWWNAVYRKIFGYNQWESVKEVIYFMGRLDVHHLLNMRRLLFLKRLTLCNNKVMKGCFYRFRCDNCELTEVQREYHIDIDWTAAKIKAMMFVEFRQIFACI